MADQLDTVALRAQMAALDGHATGPWKVSPTDDTTVITHDRNIVAEIDGDYNEPDLWPIMEANARLIAAAPDMRATILALCDEVERLRAFIADFADMKIEAIYPPPDPRDPCDVGDPVTDYLAVEALQEDARAALAQKGGEA